MTSAKEYRDKAAASFQFGTECPDTKKRDVFLRIGNSYLALADQEDWLDGAVYPLGGSGFVSGDSRPN